MRDSAAGREWDDAGLGGFSLPHPKAAGLFRRRMRFIHRLCGRRFPKRERADQGDYEDEHIEL